MKKLMIALAAAATTMFSFGDLPTGTSFEDLQEGPVTVGGVANRDDSGTTGGDFYWYSTASETDELGAITNEVASGVSRPDLFADPNQANTKSLQIDTTAPLVRTALPNAGASKVTPVDIDSEIYLDTLVKFTAADEAFAEDLTGGDKIAIEYVEHEAEGDDVGYTNFVIRAGFIAGAQQIDQTNYFAAVPANFDKDAWHRLTVRTIADVGDGHVGFVIYLDGDVNKTLEYSKNVDAGFGTLSGVAAKFYNTEKHALFPSAILAGATGGSSISSVAFSGNGFIDDVSFAADAPNFIKAGEAVVATFVADAGVTAISVSVAGVADPISVVNGSATLPAQTTAFTVNVTVDEANGYTFGSMTVGDAVYNTNPASVTGYTGGDITITTTRNNFNLFDENGDPIQGPFQTLTEALAAQGVATIKLAYDYDVDENESASFVTYAINNDVTLDLNGKTITAVDTEEEALFTVGAGAELVVIDSVGGGAIDYDTEYGVFDGDGETVVGATSGDFGPTIIGPLLDTEADPAVEVVRAKLDGEGNSDTEDKFAFEDYIATGSDVSDDLVNGYWVVAPSAEPPAPPTYTLTLTVPANVSATYAIGGDAATAYTEPVSVESNATVTITATPAANYTYTNVELGQGWTLSEGNAVYTIAAMEAATAVTVPTPDSAVIGTYQVTMIPTNNTSYAVTGAASNEGDVYTVATGHSITITVTPDSNYEYATTPDGWTAGENGVITIEVSEAGTVAIPGPTEKGGKTYPSYIDDTEKTKYDTWAAYAEISAADFPDASGSNEEAYLLNCKPSEVAAAKAAFKFTSISYDTTQSKWITTTTTSYNERGYNGEVVVKQYSDVGCKTESSTGTFFKAFLQ